MGAGLFERMRAEQFLVRIVIPPQDRNLLFELGGQEIVGEIAEPQRIV
jgi:hypothetical protein